MVIGSHSPTRVRRFVRRAVALAVLASFVALPGAAQPLLGGASADISLTKTESQDPIIAGGNFFYTLTANNAGPSAAANASLTDTLPAGTTFVDLSPPGGWGCTTPAVGSGGLVSCTNPSFGVGSAVFTLQVNVTQGTPPGVLSNSALLTSDTPDPNPGDTNPTVTTTVLSPANIDTATKTAAGTFETGSTVTYTVTLISSGPSTQHDNPGDELADVLPAGLALVSATADSGIAVANVGTNTVTWNGSIPPMGIVRITITATIVALPGTLISNQGSVRFDNDGNGTNQAENVTDDPNTAAVRDPTVFVVGGSGAVTAIPALDWRGLLALAALLGAAGALWLRRG